MNPVQVGQKSYQLPPQDGFTVAPACYVRLASPIGQQERGFQCRFARREGLVFPSCPGRSLL